MAALRKVISTMAVHSELEVAVVFEQAMKSVSEALANASACLHLHDDQNGSLELVAASGLEPLHINLWRHLDSNSDSWPIKALRMGQSMVLDKNIPNGMSALVCVPVEGLEIRVGVISVFWPRGTDPDADEDVIMFLEAMADLLAVGIEHYGLVSEMVDNMGRIVELKSQAENHNQELKILNDRLQNANKRLVELSITDGLTGLYNNRYMHQRMEEELRRSARDDKPLSLIMADLDHFKRLNDKLGHLQGDEALRRFADWTKNCVRQTDLVGRYGGEEFLVLLLDCDLKMATKVAEKIRCTVARESQAPPFDGLGGFTASMGVAQWRPDLDVNQLIEMADQALYRAKDHGRNRVMRAV